MDDLYQKTKDCDAIGCETYNLMVLHSLPVVRTVYGMIFATEALKGYNSDQPQ